MNGEKFVYVSKSGLLLISSLNGQAYMCMCMCGGGNVYACVRGCVCVVVGNMCVCGGRECVCNVSKLYTLQLITHVTD